MEKQVCSVDGKSFGSSSSMHHHNKADHLNKIHSCNLCTKTFKTKRDLRIHESRDVHSKAVFKCDQCDNVFKVKRNMKRHIESAHEKKKFHCSICGMGLCTKEKVKKHYEKCKEKQVSAEKQELITFFKDDLIFENE